MKKTTALFAALSLGMLAAPISLRASDKAGSAATVTIGKNHEEINAWLDQHPKIKEKALAQFDTNHDGKIDGDEIPPFLKWLKERREKRKGLKEDGGETTKTTPPAITSPTVPQ